MKYSFSARLRFVCCSEQCQSDHRPTHKERCKEWFAERLENGDGNVSDMQPRIERELAKVKRDKGERHVDTIRCLLKLATLNERIAQFDEAEALTREALDAVQNGLDSSCANFQVQEDEQERTRGIELLELLAQTLSILGDLQRGRICGFSNAPCC